MRIRLRTLLILLLLAAGAVAALVYAGVYNVGATVQHTKPVYRLLEYAMRQSLKLRAHGGDIPDLSGRARITRGLALYRSHCLQCHGAPGIAPERFAMGMMPAPASLVTTAREWQPAEIHWAVSQGIKMSGMPAWEYRLSAQEIWDVVAFVAQLPQLSPLEYAQLSAPQPPGTGSVLATAAPAAGNPVVNDAAAGNIKAGKRALNQYLCVTCHQIPGVSGANKHVGPPLNGIGSRKYIAGVLPNTPENMVHWLRNPQQFEPGSAMPNLGVNDKDARDIAAYLYTLNDPD